MASSKRPPLEMDDLTNNLKQSSGKGVDAFFSSPPTPQEEKKPLIHEEQEKKENHCWQSAKMRHFFSGENWLRKKRFRAA
jgi:hypothetical protein